VHVQTIDQLIDQKVQAAVKAALATLAGQQTAAGDAVMDTHQAAAFLNLSRVQLSRMRDQGRGPEYIKAGTKVLYKTSALQTYLASLPTGGGA
jgi:hypothetical protein